MRKNFVRSVTACFIAVCIVMGCKKDENQYYSSISSITISLENGTYWDEFIDWVYASIGKDDGNDNWFLEKVAESEYFADGFTIDLPESVDNLFLYPIWDEKETEDWIKISDKTTLATRSLLLLGHDSNNELKGRFYHEKGSEEGDHFQNSYSHASTEYFYVNKDVTIKGSFSKDSIYKYYNLNYNVKINQSADISMKKGWNIIYFTTEINLNKRGNDVTGTITTKTSTQNPGGLKWYFERLSVAKSNHQADISEFSKKINLYMSDSLLNVKIKEFEKE
ncbi:MAG: hypothetical protein FWH18_09280 [Marinilabiliaceae bacterium]|nr:hypothetical protein [Marinilabiliaceae bacterium]